MAKKDPYVTQNREFKAIVEAALARAGIDDKKDLGPVLHVCTTTVYNKLKKPETMTLGELRRLFAYFNVRPEDIARIF